LIIDLLPVAALLITMTGHDCIRCIHNRVPAADDESGIPT
jgi:hypothetical protein